MPRDFQRQRVYNWEKAQKLFGTDKHMEFTDCRRLALTLWAKYIPTANPPTIVQKDWRSRSCFRYNNSGSINEIILSRHGQRAEQTLHELAHAIVWNLSKDEHSFHGPEFMAVYITLLTHVGYDKDTLIKSARAAGVAVHYICMI